METILWAAVSNTGIAAILGLIAAVVSRFSRRPALIHALWVVVLIKLVTPPVWTLPVPQVFRQANQRALEQQEQSIGSTPTEFMGAHAGLSDAAASGSGKSIRPSWTMIVAGVWVAGSMVCAGIALRRVARFRKILRYATPGDESIGRQARDVARRLGLEGAPPAWLLPGQVCPMLWATVSGVRLLLPAGLWGSLSVSQQSRLIAHELAHLRRGDHRVRWLELAATIVCWWNPVLWWARHGLHEAEEACCDAWVTRAFPDGAQEYATALVEAIEFAAVARAGPADRLPAFASGVGGFHSLERRLVMIQKGANATNVGRVGKACIYASILLLPVSYGRGQSAQSAPSIPVAASTPPAPTTQSAEEQKLNAAALAKLNRILPALQFDAVGFADVIDFLHDVSGAKISVRWDSLEAAGVDRNTPVSMSLRDVRFSKALDLLLKSAAGGRATLSYSVQDGAITIIATDPVPVILTTYGVKRLIDNRPELADVIVKQIVSTIDPTSWQEAGGKKGMIKLTDGKLYVAQTADNQKLVVRYLGSLWAELRKATDEKRKAEQKKAADEKK